MLSAAEQYVAIEIDQAPLILRNAPAQGLCLPHDESFLKLQPAPMVLDDRDHRCVLARTTLGQASTFPHNPFIIGTFAELVIVLLPVVHYSHA